MTRKKQTGAEFIAAFLHEYGVTHVFYIEGILRKALVEMEKLGIKRIVTHSEKAAAYMADGFARASLRPGVCIAQSVGAANLAAALQDAYLGLSPVVAITGKQKPLHRYRDAYQEIEHAPMFNSVTKFHAEVDMIEQLPLYLSQAFREATSGAPRPVHLDMIGKLGVEICEAEADLELVADTVYAQCPPFRPRPGIGEIKLAADAIGKSKRPVIVAAGGVRASSAAKEVVQLAEKLGIPVATSLNGKGTIAENHPLSVGLVGLYSRSSTNKLVSEADLVIFIGSKTGEQVTNLWQVPQPGTQIIQIDINSAELGKNYPNTIGITGDAREATAMLLDNLINGQDTKEWQERARQLVSEWEDTNKAVRESTDTPIRPERLCHELNQRLPADAVFVVDTGYSGIWGGTLIELTSPDQVFLRAAGSLGWAFPAALGAKCACPDKPVICFTGDGGFLYHLAELETASRWGINTITIVNNNSGYGQSQLGIFEAYGDTKGKVEDLYRFRDTNLAKIAEEFGCLGIRVTDPNKIGQAIDEALAADQPVLIDVVTDIHCTTPAPWSPNQQ